MTFEPVDDEEVEASLEAAGGPVEPIRGPFTLARERRILVILRVCGPLTEAELAEFLGIRARKLGKPLINLAATGQVVCTRAKSFIGPSVRTWHLPEQDDAGNGPDGAR